MNHAAGSLTVSVSPPLTISASINGPWVTIMTPLASYTLEMDGMTANETIDLLCAKLQAAKTTDKREGNE